MEEGFVYGDVYRERVSDEYKSFVYFGRTKNGRHAGLRWKPNKEPGIFTFDEFELLEDGSYKVNGAGTMALNKAEKRHAKVCLEARIPLE